MSVISTIISVFLAPHQLVYLCPIKIHKCSIWFQANIPLIFCSSVHCSKKQLLRATDSVVVFFVHAVHTLLAYALLQSNLNHFSFAYLPKYQALSFITLFFSAPLYVIFVGHYFLPLSFHLIFWIALMSHRVFSCSLHKKKLCSFSYHLSEMLFLCHRLIVTSQTVISVSILTHIPVMILSLIKDFVLQDQTVGLKRSQKLYFSFLSLGFLDIDTHMLACVYILWGF